MSLELYVGNYPSTFTNEDILNLFQDFEGVEVVRAFRKEQKCFSFLKCCDQEQVIDVVTTLHDIDVCGRNLIVRAVDQNLQKEILVALQENDILDKHPQNKHSLDINSYSLPIREQKISSFDQSACNDIELGVRFKNPMLNSQGPKKHEKPKICDKNDKEECYPNDNVSFHNKLKQGEKSNTSYYHDQHKNKSVANPKNNVKNSESFHGRKSSSPNPNSKHFYPFERNSESANSSNQSSSCHPDPINLFFVSVFNFPLGTTVRDIFDLFMDFNPCDVTMVCNNARMDKTLTEAIVAFERNNDATDAILALDNTTYRRRSLLVADLTDPAIVQELLGFGSSKHV